MSGHDPDPNIHTLHNHGGHPYAADIMNDADLGDNIEERAAQLEDQERGAKRFENDDVHMVPT